MLSNGPLTYKGTCHCGTFQFSLTNISIKSVIICNCSLCTKKGYLWIYPTRGQFQATKGGFGSLQHYQFGDKKREHLFCPTCGTGIADQLVGTEDAEVGNNLRINARALLDVNPFSLEIKKVNGLETSPKYKPTSFKGTLPEVEGEGLKLYTGSCYCGAVTLALKSKPLSDVQIKEDNCSICQRNANKCIYPHLSQVSIHGEENTTEYKFGRKFTGHRFCKTCGVQIHMKIYGPPKEVWDKIPEERKELLKGNFELLPIRVGVLDGLEDGEWEESKVERSDVGTDGFVVD